MNVMKLKNIYMLAGALFFGTVALTSCSEDDSYDFDGSADNLAYFPISAQTPFQSTITITPAGAIGAVGDKINVLFQRPVSAATRVSVQANTALAEAYNTEHGTNYAVIPADYFDYSLATVTVEQGQTESADGLMVKVLSDKLPQMTDEAGYIAAFNISDVQGAGKSSVSRNTYYAIVNTTVQDKLHVVSGDVASGTILYVSPLDMIIGGVSFDQPFSFSGALNNDATITLTQNDALISTFNSERGQSVVALPSGFLNIENTTVTVKEGATASEEHIKMSIPESKYAELADGEYLVPFTIAVTKGDGSSVANAGEFYLKVVKQTTEGIVRNGGSQDDLLGTAVGNDVKQNWTVIAAENLDPAKYVDMYAGGWSSAWVYNEAYSSAASFTLDFGTAINLSAFSLNSYPMTSFTAAISTDNVNWIELPTEGIETISDSNWNNWYALYAGVAARYMKFDITLDPAYWGWQYLSWGYAAYGGISSIDIMTVE